VEGGTVTLNLLPLIDRALAATGDLLSNLLGREIHVPTAEEIAAAGTLDNARHLLEERLGVELPDDFGQIVVFRSDSLAAAQEAVRLLDRFVRLLIVVTLILLAAALVLSVARRRTLIQLAAGVLLGALVARLLIGAIQEGIVDRAANQFRGAVLEVVTGVFVGLLDFTTWLIVAGAVVAVAAHLAGRPMWLRRLGERLRTAPGGEAPSRVAAWAHAHSDGLRLGGVVVALIALFLVHLSWASIILILVLLGLYELGLGYLQRSLPSAAPVGSKDR
jgi:hypothetical protein